MRKSILVALGVGALAGLVLAVALHQPVPPTAPLKPEAPVAPPAPAPQPPAAAGPSQSAPATTAAVPPAQPPVSPTPDLPTVNVPERLIHAVPDETPAAPKVTLFDRNGKEQTAREAMATPPQPSRASPSAPATAAPFAPATVFGGPAQAAGGTTLAVAGQSVQLFGVRVADPRDRCALGFGDGRSCADVARDTLAQRLKRYPIVQCHLPPGQRGNPAAICIDNSGTDLGGFLISEGFALADLGQSYEYLGAEGVARSFRRGLWHNR